MSISIGSTKINTATYTPREAAPAEKVDLPTLQAKIQASGSFPDLIGSVIRMIAGGSPTGTFDIDVTHTKATLTLGQPPVITVIEQQGGRWMKTVNKTPATPVFTNLTESSEYTKLTTLFIQTFKDSRKSTGTGLATSSAPSPASIPSSSTAQPSFYASPSATPLSQPVPASVPTGYSHSPQSAPSPHYQRPSCLHPTRVTKLRVSTHTHQRKAHVMGLKHKHAQQASTLKSLRKEKEQLKQDALGLKKVMRRLEEELDKAHTQNHSQKAGLEQSQKDLEFMGISFNAAQSNLEQTQQLINENEGQISTLKSALATTKEQLEAAKQETVSVRNTTSEQISLLDQQLSEATKARETAQTQLQALSSEKETLQTRLQQEKAELTQRASDLQERIANLEQNLSKTQNINSSQNTELTQAKESIVAAQSKLAENQVLIAQKQTEIAQLETTVATTQAQLKDLEAQTASALNAKSEAVSNLEQQLAEALKANKAVQTRLQTVSSETEILQAQLRKKTLEDSHVDFGTDSSPIESQDNLSYRLDKHMRLNAELNRKLQLAETLRQHALDETKLKEDMLERQAQELENLTKQLNNQTPYMSESDQNDELQELQTELSKLKEKYKTTDEARARLADKLDALKNDPLSTGSDQSAAMETLKKQLASLRRENATLLEEREHIEHTITNQASTINDLHTQLSRKETSELQDMPQIPETDNTDLLATLSEYKGYLIGAKEEIERLTQALELQKATEHPNLMPAMSPPISPDTTLGFSPVNSLGSPVHDDHFEALRLELEQEKAKREVALEKAVEASRELEEKTQELAAAKNHLAIVQTRLEEQEQLLSQQSLSATPSIISSDEDNTELLKENHQLSSDLENMKSINAALEKQLQALDKDKKEWEDSQTEIDNLNATLEDINAQLAKATKLNESLRAKLYAQSDSDDASADEAKNMTNLNRENTQLKEQLDDRLAEIETLQANLTSLTEQVNSEKEQNEATRIALDSMKQFLDSTFRELLDSTNPNDKEVSKILAQTLQKGRDIQV